MGRIVLALDELDLRTCVNLIQVAREVEYEHGEEVHAIKIHSLWDHEGPGVIQKLKKAGARRVKLDLKFHDIPNTVRLRTIEAVNAGADIVTVHITGGIDMMLGALDGANGQLDVWGITALTSLSEEEVHLDSGHPSKATVLHRARMAKLAGLPAVVCSPQETAMLRKRRELEGLGIVNPGIRSPGVEKADQIRVDTPFNAFKAGATHIVVGREFTASTNPAGALSRIIYQVKEIAQVV